MTASITPSASETAQVQRPAETGGSQALVPINESAGQLKPMATEGPLGRLPVELEVGVPLRNFRVRNLLSLNAGVIIESQWVNGEDVPVAAGEVQLAWAEFEVMDMHLAVRLTRLS